MTEQFTINTLDGSIDLRNNGKPMTWIETVDLLNYLSEENKQLKKEKEHTVSCLKEQFDYANKQRMINLPTPMVAMMYEIMAIHTRQLAKGLGVDLVDSGE